jgi:hypothetical protein
MNRRAKAIRTKMPDFGEFNLKHNNSGGSGRPGRIYFAVDRLSGGTAASATKAAKGI